MDHHTNKKYMKMKNNKIMEKTNKSKGGEVVDHIGLVRFGAHGNVGSKE